MTTIIILVLIVLVVAWIVSNYNQLVRFRNKCKASWAQIEVQLTRRADLIPNLVETVKGYASHEEGTLKEVVEARNKFVKANGIDDQINASGELTQALSRLMMLSEAYPDLKANENFVSLQNDLKDTEDKIAYARQFYNDDVAQYINRLEMFPSSIIASMFHFESMPFFKADERAQEVPHVSF